MPSNYMYKQRWFRMVCTCILSCQNQHKYIKPGLLHVVAHGCCLASIQPGLLHFMAHVCSLTRTITDTSRQAFCMSRLTYLQSCSKPLTINWKLCTNNKKTCWNNGITMLFEHGVSLKLFHPKQLACFLYIIWFSAATLCWFLLVTRSFDFFFWMMSCYTTHEKAIHSFLAIFTKIFNGITSKMQE